MPCVPDIILKQGKRCAVDCYQTSQARTVPSALIDSLKTVGL